MLLQKPNISTPSKSTFLTFIHNFCNYSGRYQFCIGKFIKTLRHVLTIPINATHQALSANSFNVTTSPFDCTLATSNKWDRTSDSAKSEEKQKEEYMKFIAYQNKGYLISIKLWLAVFFCPLTLSITRISLCFQGTVSWAR